MKRALLLVMSLVLSSGCQAGIMWLPSASVEMSPREAERIATWLNGGMALQDETLRTTMGDVVERKITSISADDLSRRGLDVSDRAYIVTLVESESSPFAPSLTGKYKRGTVVVLVKEARQLFSRFSP